RLTFDAICGNQYLIEVGHYDEDLGGTGVITITCSGTPCGGGNDNIGNAEVVGNVVNKTFNTSGATYDGPGSCNIHHSPNLWYRYTATCTGQAVISLCGSSFDTLLAVYTGTSVNNLSLVGCNDNACGEQSQLTLNVTSGKIYWIEVSGFYPNDVGQGTLNISCNGQVQQASDLGDAPDSTNHEGRTMKTYGGTVVANFPTVYQGNPIHGPIHFQPKAKAYLGNDVTFEDEADTGYDQDPKHNIVPTDVFPYSANNDLGDDCIVNTPIYMNHCKLTAFDYKVFVTDLDPNVDLYVNVWIDWNRDGDWNDDGHTDQNLRCTTCNSAGYISEWCVQNQLLHDLQQGENILTTPGFLAWYPEYGDTHAWMRIMLAEKPWKGGSGAAGSGPAQGYEYGETEDYYLNPSEGCMACEDLNRDGEIDVNDLVEYMISWLNNCGNY
ncbi:MAG: GEVED domain-containing protein, partial [Sedimentisphaerales bacterium]